MKEPLILDIETTGTDPFEDRLICLGWQADDLHDGDVVVDTGRMSPDLMEALKDPERSTVCHTKYDIRWLRLKGYDVQGPLYDTQVMAWLLDENTPLSLAWCAENYSDEYKDERLVRKGGQLFFKCDDGEVVPIMDAPLDEVVAYNAQDVKTTKRLFRMLRGRLQRAGRWDYFLEEEVPFTTVLLDMEVLGMPIDLEANSLLMTALNKDRHKLEKKLREMAKLPDAFNIDSDEQVATYLYLPSFNLPSRSSIDEELPDGFRVTKTGRKWHQGVYTIEGRRFKWPAIKEDPKTGKKGRRPPVDTKTLSANFGSDPWVQTLVSYRKVGTILTNYVEKFPRVTHNGRIYARWNQTATHTGRLSSSEPNLQNIPRRGELGAHVRSLFTGSLVIGDYSQIEPRLMAHFSQDSFLLSIYRGKEDLYRQIGHRIMDRDVTDAERDMFKTYVLALGYGAGPKKLALILSSEGHPTDTSQAQAVLTELETLLEGYFEWKEAVVKSAYDRGYVETLAGRLRRLKFDPSNWKQAEYGARQASNAVIQGSVADIVRRTMVSLVREHLLALLAQIHDELVGEAAAPDVSLLSRIKTIAEKEHGFRLSVPLVFDVKICNSWADK